LFQAIYLIGRIKHEKGFTSGLIVPNDLPDRKKKRKRFREWSNCCRWPARWRKKNEDSFFFTNTKKGSRWCLIPEIRAQSSTWKEEEGSKAQWGLETYLKRGEGSKAHSKRDEGSKAHSKRGRVRKHIILDVQGLEGALEKEARAWRRSRNGGRVKKHTTLDGQGLKGAF